MGPYTGPLGPTEKAAFASESASPLFTREMKLKLQKEKDRDKVAMSDKVP